MSEAPERIWLDWPGAKHGEPFYTEPPERDTQAGQTEYIRADIVQALTAERDRLRGLVERAQEIIDPCYPAIAEEWQDDAEAALEGEGNE